ncbi:MAG: hypothetical protein QM756_03545 [Polyangiaceae bacterium]
MTLGGATSSGGTTATTTGGTAGAGGEPGTGSLCDEYCNTVTAYCTGDALQYKDLEQCLTVCQVLPAGRGGCSR